MSKKRFDGISKLHDSPVGPCLLSVGDVEAMAEQWMAEQSARIVQPTIVQPINFAKCQLWFWNWLLLFLENGLRVVDCLARIDEGLENLARFVGKDVFGDFDSSAVQFLFPLWVDSAFIESGD